MPIAAVNGQKLYYEDTGGSGPAVIFSHGLFMDHEMFAPQVEALKSKYRCITWDERGHAGTASDALAPFSYYAPPTTWRRCWRTWASAKRCSPA